MKVKYIGDRAVSLSSLPAGVLLHLRPGTEMVVDAGFSYLKDDPRFEILDEDELPESAKPPKPPKPPKA